MAQYDNPATSESYVATSEQVVEFPATAGHQHSPTRKEVYKDHGVGDNPLLGPWSSALEKGDKFSPKFDQSKGSTQNIRDNSPPSGDHYGKDNNNLSSSHDDDDDNDDDDDDVICEDGVCYPKPKHIKEEDYDNEKHKGNGYAAPWARAKADRKYTGTIDSKEAARKYNGVFVPASLPQITILAAQDVVANDHTSAPKGNIVVHKWLPSFGWKLKFRRRHK